MTYIVFIMNLRFISDEELTELINLYHLARCHSYNKHDRMILASKWFSEKHPFITSTAAYKDLYGYLELS